MQYNMGDARKNWDSLVAAIERGQEVILARNGKPVARIIREETPKAKPDVRLIDESTTLG